MLLIFNCPLSENNKKIKSKFLRLRCRDSIFLKFKSIDRKKIEFMHFSYCMPECENDDGRVNDGHVSRKFQKRPDTHIHIPEVSIRLWNLMNRRDTTRLLRSIGREMYGICVFVECVQQFIHIGDVQCCCRTDRPSQFHFRKDHRITNSNRWRSMRRIQTKSHFSITNIDKVFFVFRLLCFEFFRRGSLVLVSRCRRLYLFTSVFLHLYGISF